MAAELSLVDLRPPPPSRRLVESACEFQRSIRKNKNANVLRSKELSDCYEIVKAVQGEIGNVSDTLDC